MYSAAAVANAFLDLAQRDGVKLTNMKLQKLVYIAHGWCLALLKKPLIGDDIRAWQFGPVIPNLYDVLRFYGASVVTEHVPAREAVDPGCPEMGVIRAVWNSYKGYPAFMLSAITHRPGTPWSETWAMNQYGTIEDELISAHYNQLRVKRIAKPRAAANE